MSEPRVSTLLLGKPKEKLDDILSLSCSKVKTFKDCKTKYRFSYIEKLPKKEWAHLIFGKFLHDTLEKFHLLQLDGRTEALNFLMSEAFKESSKIWAKKLKPEERVEAKQILVAYLKSYVEAEDPPQVLAVEKNFYINIDYKILLTGFIDRVQRDADGVLHVTDYKTTKNKKYLKNDFFQLLTYAFAMCLEDPELQTVRVSYLLLRHNSELIVKEYSRDEIMKSEQVYLDWAEKIMSEKLYRASPTALCNWCEYLEICDSGKDFMSKQNFPFNKNQKLTFGEEQW